MTGSRASEAPFVYEELVSRWEGLREGAPVRYDEQRKTWLVTDHENVAKVLSDPKAFSSDFSGLTPTQEDFEVFRQGNFVGMDPPRHRTLRALVSQGFTPRVVTDLEPRIHAITEELLDAVDGQDQFDAVDALAYPLPIIVIAELLGIPVSDRPLFQEWATTLFGGDDLGDMLDMADIERALKAIAPTVREMNGYFLDHIRHHRKNPGDDLTSKLIGAEAEGTRLSDQEIVGFVALLLVAGHITTTALLGNALLCFDRHPDTVAPLRADPGLLPRTAEEVLRFLPPFPELGRRTTREVELSGAVIPADALVTAHLGAANRDRARFADAETFDPARDPNPHLTFGHGIHFCFGAPLARLEARIALRLLFDRFSDLAVADRDAVVTQNPAVIVGARHLPLRVRRAPRRTAG
ncbi:cytochrome P450 [Streptomyces buecherae]|uniref:cytochrome P450 n=1 Tax=Streptomyces buecherae TaxID=2763006 RepID=UPI001E4F1EFA|nr:cytochrome P450 [Streptomyces buecherae]